MRGKVSILLTVVGVICLMAQPALADSFSLYDLGPGGGSFTIGDKTFSDFSAILTSSGAATPQQTDPLADALKSIIVTTDQQGGLEGFIINTGFSAVGPPASWVDLSLRYKCAVNPESGNLIDDVLLLFNGSKSEGAVGIASVTETVHKDSFVGPQIGQVTVDLATPQKEIDLSEFVDTVYVEKDILLSAFNGYFTISFVDQYVSQVPVPEPGTIVLLGAGLIGLGYFGRRRMKR